MFLFVLFFVVGFVFSPPSDWKLNPEEEEEEEEEEKEIVT